MPPRATWMPPRGHLPTTSLPPRATSQHREQLAASTNGPSAFQLRRSRLRHCATPHDRRHSGNGIRTRVPALRGLCPSPLDDTASDSLPIRLRQIGGGTTFSFTCRIRGANAPLTDAGRRSSCSFGTYSARSRFHFVFQQARRDLNPQPPVLETGALPIELLTYRARWSTSATSVHSPSPVSRPPSVLTG